MILPPLDLVFQTNLWKKTLADSKGAKNSDPGQSFRSKLREAFLRFRERAAILAGEIPLDLKHLTVHDMTHIDSLWQIADKVVGEDVPFTPTEGFVLGGAFLLHDLGLALASYPGGRAELEKDPAWKDAVIQFLRRKLGRSPSPDDLLSRDSQAHQFASEQVLRARHAVQAQNLATQGFRHRGRDLEYHLIEDEELRANYGNLIGRIAHSHWWPAQDLRQQFATKIGAYPGSPTDWTVDPLKLALIVRAADACHLDARRAPGFLRALRKPTGEAEKHWRFQEYIQTPYVANERVCFTASRAFPLEDMETWWLGYELIALADRELHSADMILRDANRSRFAANSVAGANDALRLVELLPTSGWKPVSTQVRVSDVAGLVRKLGGTGLYGENPRVPLRELIQNARDAVVARRVKENRDAAWGQITVRLICSDEGEIIEVSDTGLGMSEELLVGPFLDFGVSYWNSALVLREHPGLAADGFEPQGKFGIGFFSVFIWGSRIKIVTRRPEDGVDATRVLEFREGLTGRPILRLANPDERRFEPGTSVHVSLEKSATEPGGPLGPGPIESWTNAMRGQLSRASKWSLKDLCAWLCPAIDVDLFVEEGGTSELSVKASDWANISPVDLLRRLLLHRDDLDSICTRELFQIVASNLRDMKDVQGKLLGRAAICSHFFIASGSEFDLNQASTITAGGFRTIEQLDFLGLLIGETDRAARTVAVPLVFRHPVQLADWASGQAELVGQLQSGPFGITHHTSLIREFGGNTQDLPIARSSSGVHSFNDIAESRDLPNEILLHEDRWGVQGWRPVDLPTNGIAVGSGRSRTLCNNAFNRDPRQRADHPRWNQYWPSSWGATIEAIALAWNVPLQKVLESSEIAENGMVEVETNSFRSKVDIIRKPPS
jgi:hypothetical protein